MEGKNYYLSEKEKQVLEYFCKGLTPKEVAEEMHLTIHTIQYHQRSIINKLQVKKAIDIVPFAREHQLCV